MLAYWSESLPQWWGFDKGVWMKCFIMPDQDFNLSTEEGRKGQRKAIVESVRRFNPNFVVPSGGARGGVGRDRIVHNSTIHNIK